MNTESKKLVEDESRYILQTYKRLPLVIERGQGAYLYDQDGKQYLDMVAGIAVDTLGHSNPDWIEALCTQAKKLVHTANIVYTEPGVLLAKKLVELSGLQRTFFCNSGTEAVEAAFKIARKWGLKNRGDSCYKIISFEKGFHGRTFGALSATANLKYREPFKPLVPGFITLNIDQHLQFEAELASGEVCAVILEVIQGEGGVQCLAESDLIRIASACQQHNVLLICDEIQTGIARTGKWFAYQNHQFVPDIVTLAKGLGGGFPIGAVLVGHKAEHTLEAGDHGSTYAGNPLATAVALKVLQIIERDNLLAQVEENGGYLQDLLKSFKQDSNKEVTEIRGRGLIQAIQFKEDIARKIVTEALSKGLLLNATADNTLRLVPPLIINKEQLSYAVNTIAAICKAIQA